jgi:hypothetical protein
VARAEFEQFDHLPRTFGSAMAQVQCLPQLVEGCRPSPRQPPLRQRSRACQCARLFEQYIEIVLQIKDLLLAAIAAFMPRNALASMAQLNGSGMNSGFNPGARRQRNRVAVGPYPHATSPSVVASFVYICTSNWARDTDTYAMRLLRS